MGKCPLWYVMGSAAGPALVAGFEGLAEILKILEWKVLGAIGTTACCGSHYPCGLFESVFDVVVFAVFRCLWVDRVYKDEDERSDKHGFW